MVFTSKSWFTSRFVATERLGVHVVEAAGAVELFPNLLLDVHAPTEALLVADHDLPMVS